MTHSVRQNRGLEPLRKSKSEDPIDQINQAQRQRQQAQQFLPVGERVDLVKTGEHEHRPEHERMNDWRSLVHGRFTASSRRMINDAPDPPAAPPAETRRRAGR